MTTYFNSPLLAQTQKQGQASNHFAVFSGHSSPENHAFAFIDVVAEKLDFIYIDLLFFAAVFVGAYMVGTETQTNTR